MSILPETPEDPLAPHLGDRIRIARERAGYLKLGDFAERIGCDRKSLSRYERNEATPRPYVLRAIAEETGLTLAELTGDLDNGPSPGGGGGHAVVQLDERREQVSDTSGWLSPIPVDRLCDRKVA